YRTVRQLKRHLTFREVDKRIAALEQLLYENIFLQATSLQLNRQYLLDELYAIRTILMDEHHSLYLNELDSFIHKVKLFGTHFAALDIRQNSSTHKQVIDTINSILKEKTGTGILPDNYAELTEADKVVALAKTNTVVDIDLPEGIARDTIN
ncbi:phosphoenolpyruvate carboxylase, partial [Bradyrhizobium sp. NBAIM08]|uniref:phosphoenolpyruvate carboxylase n=1 Tax=Bradyrhizobium sp. NBAIM08 TaxID=2793815 RepID=UPI001CD2636F